MVSVSTMGNATARTRLAFRSGLAALAAAALFSGAANAAAGDDIADRVFGQPDFSTADPFFGGASGLRYPRGVAIDPTNGRLYVADQENNRVLGWANAAAFTNGEPADRVIGQSSFTEYSVNGSPFFSNSTPSTLYAPTGVAVSASGTLYVADYGNNRVLIFTPPIVSGMSASGVLGQPDFATSSSGTTAGSFDQPLKVAVDATDHVYVVDLGNHRVLRFGPGASTASRVFGQPGFTSGLCNNGGLSASSLCYPMDAAVDAAGNLYIADGVNNRLLRYDDPLGTDTIADRVYGQVDFESLADDFLSPNAATLYNPRGIAIGADNRLYVADNGGNRVLIYDDAAAGDTIADRVIGQGGSFTSRAANPGGLGASGFYNIYGIAVDAAGNLYVADGGNHRVLGFDQPAGSAAPGSGSYTGPSATGTGNITAAFNGGGASCAFSSPQFIAAPPGAAPVPPTLPTPSATFPHGLFDFSVTNCTIGGTLSFTIVYPQPLPAGTVYYKYGPTTSDTTAHWYILPATVSGNSVTFSITDGGLGDDDLAANGTIVDQGGPAAPPPGGPSAGAPASAIPTLSARMLALLALLIAASACAARPTCRKPPA